jgi:hypothetical protein
MNQAHYQFQYAESERLYEFYSIGPRGAIRKIVQFRLLHDNIYNLGFGDFNEELNAIDDSIVSNNGDMRTVLATIVVIVQNFFSVHLDSGIFLTGSNEVRTRLYQIAISTNFEELRNHFEIFGFDGDEWHTFQKNTTYESFMVLKMF